MKYKDYFLQCRENFSKPKPSLSSFYNNPVRQIPDNILEQATKDALSEMSDILKKDFNSGKHNLGSIHGIKNIWKYKKPLISACNNIVPYLEDTMFGCNLYVDKIYLYRTKKLNVKKDSYLWHHDNNPNEIVKVIIYLNEVNELNSPFEYLVDKNNDGVLAECTRLGPEKWEPAPNDGRLEDEVNELIKSKNYHNKKLLGKQFTACAFSNNAIHRANPIIKGYRDVLNIRVKPTLNQSPEFMNKKWTTSYGYTGAVNPNPINTWEKGFNVPKNSLKEIITNKLEKFFRI